jgi:glutathione synthase
MSFRLGIVMDPIEHIKPWKDTSLAMLLEASHRGWELFYMTPADLLVEDGQLAALTCPLAVFDDNHHWFEKQPQQRMAINELDMLLMRQDPPFNNNYLYVTYLLEKAEQAGVRVVNRPASVRDCNEKLFITEFSQCTTPHLVSSNAGALRAFVKNHRDVVLKPLDGMGGSNIFRVVDGDANLSVIIEVLTGHGTTPIMAQCYIPQIVDGDKRILMINGEPIDYALARIPKKGELRGNLAAGGSGRGQPLTERDRHIASRVGPVLKARGIYFAGLDVIGDYLTEINVTSPTCVRELDNQFNINIIGQLFDTLLALPPLKNQSQ